MSLTTVAVSVYSSLATGQALANGRVRLMLTSADVDGSVIAPTPIDEVLDNNGFVVVNLWPNARGTQNSQYNASFYDSNGRHVLDVVATIPASNCNLHDHLATLVTDPGMTSLAASSGSSLVGFTQSGTGAVARTVQDKARDVVSVKDFGAKGDGVTDDSAAFLNAIAALGSNGGRVRLDALRYKVKLGAITTPNITIEGTGFYRGVSNSQLVAADNTDYILQVGDGTTMCKGFTLRNVALDGLGGAAAKGMKINGADCCTYQLVTAEGFSTHALYVTSSASQTTSFQWFHNCDFLAGNVGTAIGVEMDYGASWATSVYFVACHISSYATSKWALKMTQIPAHFIGTYFDLYNGTGISLNTAGGSAAFMVCSDVSIDSPTSTDVLVVLDQNARLGAFMSGSAKIDGIVQMPGGNTAQLTGRQIIGLNPYIESPYLIGTLRFLSGTNGYGEYDVTQSEASITRSGDVLQVKSGPAGRVYILPGNGALEMAYAGVSEFWNTNTNVGKTIWRTDVNGNMVLAPFTGKDLQLFSGNFTPTTDGASNIGAPTLRWGVHHAKPTTVAALPTGTNVSGAARAFVSDSTVVASGNFGAAVVGGGANTVPVYYDGGTSTWRIG
jgi:hypothetical protein